MAKQKILFTFFIVVFISTFNFAQDKFVEKTDTARVYKLSDVVITATKTNTNILELANSITIIDSIEIANRNKINLFNLLKTEYGLSSIQFGPAGGLSTINIRGANAGQTLILIDGIEMNLTSESSNLYDFANLPVDGIGRIEVLRGPQSTLYGSDAMAGVINIITKKGSGKPTITLFGEGGSYNSFKGALGFTGNYNNLNYNLSFGRTQSDGFSAAGEKYGNTESDGYSGNNFYSRIGYDFNKYSGINFFLRYSKAETDLDQGGGEFKDDPTYKYNLEQTSIRTEGFLNLFDGLWEMKFGGSYIRNVRKYNYDSTLFNPSSSNSFYDGRKYKIDWQNNFILPANNVITFGVETETDQAETMFYSLSAFGPYESLLPKSEVTTTGVYLQDQFKFANSFFITGGVRYDNHNKFGEAYTYRIAPAFIFWQTGTKLKATIGTSFKAPSIFYLFDPFFGNEDLNPEESFGWDVGIEQFFWADRVSFGLTYFNNDYKDLIGLDENFKSFNIDKVRTDGVEFFFSTNPANKLYLKTVYTYTNAKNKSENSADFNKMLLRRPKTKIAYLVNYSFNEKTNFNLEIIYVSERDDKDFSSFLAKTVKLDAYTLVNVAAHYDMLNFLRLFARVENIFDTQYEEVFGFGTPGLSFFGGLKLVIN
ncbi:MAG: TonB-dependent receptor [Ignavibacteriae bacterium]|nr:MAG: TonB-dependent receptor [Ignavibacteriota bacterium]